MVGGASDPLHDGLHQGQHMCLGGPGLIRCLRIRSYVLERVFGCRPETLNFDVEFREGLLRARCNMCWQLIWDLERRVQVRLWHRLGGVLLQQDVFRSEGGELATHFAHVFF